MKKLTLIFIAASLGGYAQKLKEKDVPPVVQAAFSKIYPDVKDADWEKDNGKFEVEFDVNKKEQSVVFDAGGRLVETEVEIPVSELPGAATDYIAQNYRSEKIREAAKITNASGEVSYEAEVNKKDLIFDSTGAFVKIEQEEKTKDDDK